MPLANNKQGISTFKFGHPYLTLKERPKVKSEHIRRFLTHDFLQVVFILQTSRTNNKRVISTFAIVFKLQLIYSTVRTSQLNNIFKQNSLNEIVIKSQNYLCF